MDDSLDRYRTWTAAAQEKALARLRELQNTQCGNMEYAETLGKRFLRSDRHIRELLGMDREAGHHSRRLRKGAVEMSPGCAGPQKCMDSGERPDPGWHDHRSPVRNYHMLSCGPHGTSDFGREHTKGALRQMRERPPVDRSEHMEQRTDPSLQEVSK